jgi:hypothetical protein
VTYPGGDRIDWALLTLPEKQHGKLDIEMSYVTPRPGLRLSFDLFDQTQHPIKAPVTGKGRVKTASVADVRGAVFVRVYAPRRGDAGRYNLKLKFAPVDDLAAIPNNIPEPPGLYALPPVLGPAPTCNVFNPSDPACASTCPMNGGEPTNWGPCAKLCRDQDPDDKPACMKVRPCPDKPDVRFLKCRPLEKYWPACPDPANPDPTNPRCPHTATFKSKIGRIVQIGISGGHTVVTVNVGPGSHVDSGWSARVLHDKSKPLSNGGAVIDNVTKNGEVHLHLDLKPDQLQSPNDWIELSPPP